MPLDLLKASRIQEILSKKVQIKRLDYRPKTVVGLDISYKPGQDTIGCAAAVAIRLDDLKIIDYSIVIDEVTIPYIPGFLAFREMPLMFKALIRLLKRLNEKPVLMVNGHGISHPRKLGIASHIGVVTDLPSIGVAGKLLYGDIVRLKGRDMIIVEGIIAGFVVSGGRDKKKSYYISIGHKISIEDLEYYIDRLFEPEFHYAKPPYPIHIADVMSREAARGRDNFIKWVSRNKHLFDLYTEHLEIFSN